MIVSVSSGATGGSLTSDVSLVSVGSANGGDSSGILGGLMPVQSATYITTLELHVSETWCR